MQHHKFWTVSIVFVCLLAMLAACKQPNNITFSGGDNIIGSWETNVSVLGPEADEIAPDNRVILHFVENLTGKEVQIVNGETKERAFIYRIEGETLHIEFESGIKWAFPYRLADDQLILTQNHQEIIYQKAQ